MLFNSIEFAIFLPVVFLLYWFVTKRHVRIQNILLLVTSYIFYGWWDWRFLFLIAFSTLVDYFVGLKISKSKKASTRKLYLMISILVNLGFLGFFKYFNFFADSFAAAFTFLGQSIEPTRLNIILPVGISFYTFQTLSYSIDIYKGKFEPTKDIISFMTFVSFFPQLVAGPIERARDLLPQFYSRREFNYLSAVDGMRQILWGLFKKIVIADSCAIYANNIFNNYSDYPGSTLLLGTVFFAFQIYGDFSGYSDIAIGTARLFGFNLTRNFEFPYFSRDIAEFWRRWHISLSSWFRDYVYFPLGGSRGGNLMKIRNTLIIFIVSGFWHGANWTFIIWGALNALYFLPLILLKRNRINTNTVAENSFLPSLRELFQMGITFLITCIAWVFFRADSVITAIHYLSKLFSKSLLSIPKFENFNSGILILVLVLIFNVIEWIGRKNQYAIAGLKSINLRGARWIIYIVLITLILLFNSEKQEFIYFQF